MKLLELRTEKGMSQELIARQLGVSRVTIVNWERGNTQPVAGDAIKLAKLFGVSVEEIFGECDYDKK